MIKIIVSSKHIHYSDIDTDLPGVNFIAHPMLNCGST